MRKTIIDLKAYMDLSGVTRQLTGALRLLVALIGLLYTGGSWLTAETRVLTANSELAAGSVHRLLLGDHYRDLWTTPFEVEVLDFSTEAGGLKPLFRVGGAQTFGLALKGADGKNYTFRSLNKDLAQNLNEQLRDSLVGRIFQDQQASMHPASNSMVPPLAKAAGVLHNVPRLVVLPDDPALGEFRELFAGRLGTIEEFPTEASDEYAGFQGATEIIKTNDIVTQWLASPEVRIDGRALLRLRLFDFFLGDWDRHANNYRWARLPGKTAWQPLPEDRDQAFVNFQGLIPALARPFEPRQLRFEEDYPSSIGLTLQGWPIHRWFLAELDHATWIEIANDLSNRITDDVINEAVSLMPKAYMELNANELASTLRARRDKLPRIAERIYHFINAQVDVQATDKNDRIDLRDLGDGKLAVSVSLKNEQNPYFKRQLSAGDTKSLRLYLRDGQNTVECHGLVGGAFKIDVIGNRSNDVLNGCDDAKLRFTETEELEQRKTPLRASTNALKNVALPSLNIPPESVRPRDWGTSILPNYLARFDSDDGPIAGGGFTVDRFEFGKNPFGQRHKFSAGVSLTRGAFEAKYHGVFQLWDPKLQSSLNASVSSLREADFYGFGNDTSDDGSSDFFETDQTRTTITPGLDYLMTPELNLFGGVGFNFNSTDDDEDTLLNNLAPLGVGDFGWVNLFGGLDYDTRDKTLANGAGVRVRLQGSVSPGFFDVDDSFNSVEGEVAGFFDVGRGSLVLRAGGKNVSGEFPFQEAAYLGGRTNHRGFDTNRFAGDASVFATAEYKLPLGEAPAYLAKAKYGLSVFADVGRVFVDDDEDSDDLHPAAGVSLWASALNRLLLMSLSVAQSEDETHAIFNAGFSF